MKILYNLYCALILGRLLFPDQPLIVYCVIELSKLTNIISIVTIEIDKENDTKDNGNDMDHIIS